MKMTIVISVLDSHEIFRRQLLHWKGLGLKDDIEFIIIDDGSDIPLVDSIGVPNLRILYTNDKRAWTVELARNLGAREAQGEYLLMTDIDYIIPKDAIETVYTVTEDKAGFHREFGVLDENGVFTQDFDVLRQYGLLETRIDGRGVHMPPHPNNFIMRKSTYWKLGGYREDLVDRPYPNKGDTYFKRTWAEARERGEVTIQDGNLRKTLYMFPNGQFCGDVDYNPQDLFHHHTRKTENNHWYIKQREQCGSV
jgi:hypothetical protein